VEFKHKTFEDKKKELESVLFSEDEKHPVSCASFLTYGSISPTYKEEIDLTQSFQPVQEDITASTSPKKRNKLHKLSPQRKTDKKRLAMEAEVEGTILFSSYRY
jgi:hypothetical protein